MPQHLSSEQLNFFRFSAMVLNEFPKALRQVFKVMWDSRYGIRKWDDSPMVRNMFQDNKCGNMTHVSTDKSYMEWDCTALFQATLYARGFVQSGGRKKATNLYDLYVKPRRLKGGAFHHSVWTQTGNNEETLALALDQLRLLRNALFRQTKTQSIDSSTFHNYLVLAKCAFGALRLSCESIENLLKEALLDFHALNIKELLDWVHKEKNAAIKSKQFENHLSEIKASCNTNARDHGGPKLENNSGFSGSEAKSSAVDGNSKFVMQAQKFQDLEQTAENSPRCSFQEAHSSSGSTYDRINDKFLKTRGILGSRNVCEIFVGKLDKALNFHQSEYISEARNEVHELFDLIKREDARDFRKPTRYCLEVVSRGNDLFFDNSVSFSLKHGLLVLDSSNGGVLFYASLLNVLGVLALETSEFHVAKKIFSILVAFHSTSDATSRLRDMAAAFNNRGCLSLIVGEFNHAKKDFDNSVRHLNCEKRKRQCFSSAEAMIIGVHNNVCCLNFMSRNFTKCLEKQNELLDLCKSKAPELPMQTVFMVLHNQAKTNTALGSMARAEIELKWLHSYCKTLPKRERHHLLLEFVSLQLCEVLLLSGKPEEANNVYSSERLTSECALELMPRFRGINVDLMIETFEKRIDVLVEFGKRKNALECLQKQIIFVKEHFGVKHFFVSSLLYKEGCTLKLEGKLSSAWEKFKSSSEILRDIFGEKHPLLIKCYMSLGGVSLRLGRESESHLSFQRAMENVEVIHQVSFPNQLSIRYIELTSNPKGKPFGMLQRRDVEEQMIDGLVAEHGLALAVLLSPLNPKKEQSLSETTKKGEKPLPRKIAKATQSEIFLIVSQKNARDLLLSGQTFLRLGMKNEAGAFFQLAGELCQTNHLEQGQSLQPLISLFNFISQTNFANQNKVKENSDLIRFLEELKEDAVNSANEYDAESKTEVGEKLNLDSQMDLKLVLILLILFSVQLQLHDAIFAAYDLYTSLFPSDGSFFLSANDELQIYSSRTSVTCNGKTAMQHVMFSTVTGDSRSELESFIPRNSVFRNIVYRKGMPTYSLLAIQSSDAIPDVDDIKQVEQATLRSFQEYLEIKCLDEEGEATQFIVDLSVISEKKSFLTERRVELLPLCLSEEKEKAEILNERSNVHSIVPFLCEKTAWLTFADEPTSCFMFGKIALWLLQECKWETMSSLRVQSQCLVLTVVLPVKAKITLWYGNDFIKQRVQIIFTDDGEQLLGGTGQKGSLCNSEVYNRVIEEFFAPVIIHHWTSTRNGVRKGTAITRECSWAAAPTAALHESNEPPSLQRSFEEERSARKRLNAVTLECLTAVSELTYLLHGDQHPDGAVPDVHPEDALQGFQKDEVVPKVTETDPSFSFFDSDVSSLKFDKDVTPDSRGSASISSYCHKTASISEGNTEEINDLLLTPSESANAEGSNSVAVTDKGRLLGRELFERDKKSRHFSITKLLEEMKKKEILPDPYPPVKSESHTKEECVKEVSYVEESSHQNLHCESLRSGSFDSSEHEGQVDGNKNFEGNESFSESCGNSLAFYQKHAPGILQTSEETKEQRGWVFLSAAELQNGSVCQSVIDEKEKHSATTSTTMEVALLRKKKGDHFCVTEENEANIKKVCDQQSDQHVALEGATQERGMDIRDPQIGLVERNHTEHNKEVMQLKKENDLYMGMFKSHDSQNQKKTSLLGSEINSESFKISEIGECFFVERAEDAVQNTSRYFESFNLGLAISRRKQSHDKVDVPGQIGTKLQLDQRDHLSGVSAIHRKDDMKRTPQSPFFGGDVVADGVTSDVSPDSTTVAVRPTLQLSEVQQGDTMGANIRFRFLGDDVVADAYGYLTAALPQTFQDIVDGSAIMTENPHSGDPTIEERATGNVCCGEIRGDDVKDVNKLPRIYNNCSDQVTLDKRESVDTSANLPADRDDRDYHLPGFGGARPKQGLPKPQGSSSVIATPVQLRSSQQPEEIILGLNPNFVARHAVTDDNLNYPNFDGAEWKDPLDQYSVSSKKSFSLYGHEALQNSHNSSSISRHSPESDAFDGGASIQRSVHSLARSLSLLPEKDKSWHFPPLQGTTENHTQQPKYQENDGPDHLTQDHGPMFESPKPDGSYGMVLTSTKCNNSTDSYGDSSLHSTYTSEEGSVTVHEGQRDLIEDNIEIRLEDLEKVMSRTVGLFASIGATETQVEIKKQNTEKVGIQEQAMSRVDNGQTEIAGVVYSGEQTALIPRNDQTTDTKREDGISPIQESPRPACSHYQRRCLVRFPCCGRFYPCHRCHNESAACTDDQARAINATHIRCIICYHEQVIDEGSQKCRGCNSKISDYFCAICKHFTSLDKNPFHCDKCGICRIHRDKSFHCDVCNVCLDKRLQGKHKCRPDSGHDECCICLEPLSCDPRHEDITSTSCNTDSDADNENEESGPDPPEDRMADRDYDNPPVGRKDAFSGCQILPCSHKVHKDCAIAMIQNGIRTCPICRHPLFQQPESTDQ